MTNAETVINAVTGFPLSHTWSPQLHSLIYKKVNVNAVMLAFPQRDIEAVIQCMRTLPIHMLAVTIPHKETVMKYLDVIEETAKEIGAVNTVINAKGKLYGYNTDILGIEEALKKTPIKAKNVLIIGAGGAARPLCLFLKQYGAKIFCYNRTVEKAEALMKEFGGNVITEKDLVKGKFDVIINATPIGMSPNINESPLPQNIFHEGQTVFDFIYNPLETKLLKDAKNAGATTISGVKMFIAQGLFQAQLWLGKEPKYPDIEKDFLNILSPHASHSH